MLSSLETCLTRYRLPREETTQKTMKSINHPPVKFLLLAPPGSWGDNNFELTAGVTAKGYSIALTLIYMNGAVAAVKSNEGRGKEGKNN